MILYSYNQLAEENKILKEENEKLLNQIKKYKQNEDENISIIIKGSRPMPYKRTTQNQKYVDKDYQKYVAYKQYVGIYARNQFKGHFGDSILEIDVTTYLHGKGIYDMGNDGDTDNYIKCACDSLNGIIYNDDRQIFNMSGRKISCKEKKDERMIIRLKKIK